MWFNFVLMNHGMTGSKEWLSPLTDYMRGALGRCGHETTVTLEEVYRRAINVFFEYFPDEEFIEHLLALKKANGLRMGVIATELMVGGSIPYARHGMQWTGDKTEFFRKRVGGFERVAGQADFVWSWLERTAHEYRGICPVSEFFPVGHIATIPAYQRQAPKDIDVLFFGTRTPHRTDLIGRFRALGINVLCIGRGFPLGYMIKSQLASYLDRAKIGLNLNLHAEDDTDNGVDPRFASCMRITEMLDREMCIASEEIPLDNPYRNFMVSAEAGDLAATCQQLLASGAWESAARINAQRFREQMDVVKVCGPVIDRTLVGMGIRGQLAAA